ncbi:hypothetical protein M472_03030 [Sphingobacterium paucimobilis HER1398]|uniref:Uncharacterized protein n=1 Tax=Sphingobacterium paucimobilis HER1398 TaxID=1346330 RepID=U2HQI1_9SPHI|nr:hypothetical protein M472_03030 [Sphingobacterium paucimobilis HER1398]
MPLFDFGKDIAAQSLHFTYFLETNMSRFSLVFKTLPNEARVFAVALGLFIVVVALYSSLIYLGV